MTFHAPNQWRIRNGRLGSDDSHGNNGAFRIVHKMVPLMVIASDGAYWEEDGLPGPPWEHVSVSVSNRCPFWHEMAFIKSLFWDSEDCVIQFHPPESEYVNQHPFCLHMWRPCFMEIPMPPALSVGFK